MNSMESAENDVTEITPVASDTTGVDADITGLANGSTGVAVDVQVDTDVDEVIEIDVDNVDMHLSTHLGTLSLRAQRNLRSWRVN